MCRGRECNDGYVGGKTTPTFGDLRVLHAVDDYLAHVLNRLVPPVPWLVYCLLCVCEGCCYRSRQHPPPLSSPLHLGLEYIRTGCTESIKKPVGKLSTFVYTINKSTVGSCKHCSLHHRGPLTLHSLCLRLSIEQDPTTRVRVYLGLYLYIYFQTYIHTSLSLSSNYPSRMADPYNLDTSKDDLPEPVFALSPAPGRDDDGQEPAPNNLDNDRAGFAPPAGIRWVILPSTILFPSLQRSPLKLPATAEMPLRMPRVNASCRYLPT